MNETRFVWTDVHTVDRARNLDTEGQSLHRGTGTGTAQRKHVIHKSRVPILEID